MRWSDDKRQWRRSKAGAVKKSSKPATSSVLKIAINMAILLLLVGITVIYFFIFPKYPIRHVVVEQGGANVDELAIRDKVSPHLRHGFFRTSVRAIQKDLLQLPWIKAVVVQKKWPDSVLIKLTLGDTVAKWNKNAYLLDGGVVYQTPKPLAKGVLPELNSSQNDASALLELYYAFKADLATDALSIQALNETDTHEYIIILNNGIVLNLGDKNLQQRVHRFVKTYPFELVDKAGNIAYVDLRYENGMAVGWRSDNQASKNTM